jgi:para-aminobenzoate synthetase component 1
VLIHQLHYNRDTSGLLRSLGTLPNPVLLDSGDASPSPLGRYAILSALPAATLTIRDGRLHTSADQADHPANLFACLRHMMDTYKPQEPLDSAAHVHLPFTGGLMGHIGYPKLESPGNYLINSAYFGVYLWALVVDHQSRQTTLVFLDDCPPETRNQVFYALHNPQARTEGFRLTQNFRADMSPARYRQVFETIQAYIRAGDCYQVNLTQRFSSSFSGLPLEAYVSLRSRTLAHHGAFLAWDDQALLSFSPEQFISVRGGHIETRPIKGTRPRGGTPAEDSALATQLLKSAKDRAENLMIVDLLRNDLGRCCVTGSVQVPELFKLQSLPNVHHLVSTVAGTMKPELSPLDVLACCFPGGSVTGAPKIRAMEVIEEVETCSRGPYCGSVMYLGFNGNMDSSITIRTAHCDAGQIYCWAGGAIVNDSDWAAELQECMDKIKPIINGLQDFS